MAASPAIRWRPEDEKWDPAPYLQADRTGHGRRLIFDIEGNDLLPGLTTFWCIAAVDLDTGEEFYWGVDVGPASLGQAIAFLGQADLLLAHNGIGYDYPAIEKLYPGWQRPAKAWDTQVIAKVVWPYDALVGPDLQRIKAGRMPGQFLKRHSLAAWGYRTGTHKGDYTGGFSAWSPAMAVYLMGDIRGTLALWRLIEKRIGWAEGSTDLKWPELTLEVENEVQRIIFEQEQDGVRFDREKAIRLVADLQNEQARIERKLVEAFGSWWQPLCDPEVGEEIGATMERGLPQYPDITVRRVSEKTGKELKPYVGPPRESRTKGDRHVPIEWTTFNPGSRDHLGMRLQAVYGWRPKKFGKDGKPSVDESTLEEIPDAVLPAEMRRLILDYFVVTKTLAMVSKGKKSWLGLATDRDRIHGRMDTCGAVTRRCTHSNPNLSQVPSVRKAKVKQDDGSTREEVLHGLPGRYGPDCRSLFTANDGWEQTGVDASSLELILLGHYLAPTDGGAFRDRVCDPSRDPHAEHAVICGTTRADAKTTIYLKIYGGSAYKLSLDPGIIVTPDMVPGLLKYRGLPGLLRSLEKRFDADFVAKLDDMQKARISRSRQIIMALDQGITGLADLQADVTKAAGRGWLKSFDGSKIHVRKPHAALNALLQSAGAIACKTWVMDLERNLRAEGLRKREDYHNILFVHDEVQLTHRPGLGPLIREVAERSMVAVGERYGLRGRFRTDGKTGPHWAATH
ncbi:DNA polymerase [uncultured Methylobacterium sp.]|jgi:DNA polymerase-1|uniref:DNA polymerase n=1 Tax=uncultured Methylobacterium sp. TaxID=157278 RepID=UPI00260E2E51|nr:DNA polymerase [uncultured Methylobacterium sp.]